ncbi:hypothetical protein [Psychroserpens mesophilus]|uniref:hypothetical protein n=1 Tax=Psychroserpens mesophilus TaxID=325473 RepID=UPI0006948560|nr:hypothetical protein [Psychroserpens mesophilus]
MTSLVYGQTDPDGEKKSIKIPAKETKEKDSTPTPIKIKPNPKIDITKTDENISGIPVKIRELKPEKKEFSMFDDSNLRDPGEIFEKRYNAKLEEQGLKIKTMSDMFLGDVRVNGEFANIRCRDHEYPDGDLVQVVVNDEVFIPRLLLTSNFKSFDIPLKEGINTVVFIALNQGESGPNTAEFLVYDDNEVLVSSKRWNLLTGVKAKILVIKSNDFPQLKQKEKVDTEGTKDNEN